MSKNNSERKIYLDVLRIIAAFLVIFNHLPGYALYQTASSAVETWFYTGLTMFTRINVPIFFMISGALLLGKDEPLKVIIKKRIFRFVVLILGASLVVDLALRFPVLSNWEFSWFLYRVFSGSISSSYWYLYAYLGFLFMLPFLRKMVRGMSKELFVYVIAIYFILSSLLPMFNYVLSVAGKTIVTVSGDFRVPLMTEKMLFYPLVGYFLDNVLAIEKIKRKHIFTLIVMFLSGILISSAITIHEGLNNSFTQNWVQLFDYLSAICVFILVKYYFVCKKKTEGNSGFNRGISLIGTLTLGMYLFDPVWKRGYNLFEKGLQPMMPMLIISFIWCIASMTLSGLCTYFIKKVPKLGKLL